MKPIPDDCPRPITPQRGAPNYVEDFQGGADLRRQGKARPPVERNPNSAWRVCGWDAQDEIARKEGFE